VKFVNSLQLSLRLLQPGAHHSRRVSRKFGPAHFDLRLGTVEFGLADELLLVKFVDSLQLSLRLLQPGAHHSRGVPRKFGPAHFDLRFGAGELGRAGELLLVKFADPLQLTLCLLQPGARKLCTPSVICDLPGTLAAGSLAVCLSSSGAAEMVTFAMPAPRQASRTLATEV
jgi:hypothetical protein